ncbi:MAG: hypothetical protein ABIJ57_08485, partial [Pseudomonadota bacterium]
VTAAKQGITAIYNIKSGEVAKAIKRVPAKASYGGKGNRLFTVIHVKGGRLRLHKFGGLPTSPPRQEGIPVNRRRGPTVKILKTAGRRPVRPDSTGHGPFVARMTSGFGGAETDHVGIFVRTDKRLSGNRWRGGTPGSKHQVIRELKTKGIAEAFGSRGRLALDKLLAEKGAAVVQRELNYFFEKEMKR